MVNLCGVSVGAKRWSGAFKQSLRDSRIGPTECWPPRSSKRACPLINASAVGYYGDTGAAPPTKPLPRARLPRPAVPGLGGRHRAGRHAAHGWCSRAPGWCWRRRAGCSSRLNRCSTWARRPPGQRPPVHAVDHPRRRGPGAAVRDQPRRAVRTGESDRAGAGHQRRVHRGDGPCGEPADAADGVRVRAAHRCSASSPTKACSAVSGPSPRLWSGPDSSSTTTPSVKRWRSPPRRISLRSYVALNHGDGIDQVRREPPLEVRRLGTIDYLDGPGSCSASLPRLASPADPTPSCCSSTRRCIRRANAPKPHERPTDGQPVVDTDRGGKITWHGPGQLVGYPIIGLAQPLDVVNFVRRLEDSLIAVCAELRPANGNGSRAAPGCGCRAIRGRGHPEDRGDRHPRPARATTLHGFALNCDCDLAAFREIVPCGISDAGVTSLTAELGRRITTDDVATTGSPPPPSATLSTVGCG